MRSGTKPRICMLRHSYFPFDVGSRRQALALVAAGFEVDVISLRREGEPAREKVHGVDVYRLPMAHRRSSKVRYVFQYAASLALCAAFVSMLYLRRRYHAIQVYTMPDLLAFAAVLPKLLGAKLILDIQDLMPELYRSKYGVGEDNAVVRLLGLQEGLAIHFADRVFTVTEEFKRILLARHGRSDIGVILNCPDDALFPRRTPSLPDKRSNGHRDPFVVVCHGAMLERLGYDTIVKAAALLRNDIPELDVRLAGTGEYRERLEIMISQLGVGDVVHVLGWVPQEQVPALIATADIGVVANKRDGFADLLLPTKLLEYVWMGVPTVTARTRTIENYFTERMVAFFEPGDERDLAKQILHLYRNPRHRLELAENASAFFDLNNWRTEQVRYRQIIFSVMPLNSIENTGALISAGPTAPREETYNDRS